MREFSQKGGSTTAPHLYNVELSSRAAETLLPIVDARIKFIEARIPKCKQVRVLANLQEELVCLMQCSQVLTGISKQHMDKLIAQIHVLANGE